MTFINIGVCGANCWKESKS